MRRLEGSTSCRRSNRKGGAAGGGRGAGATTPAVQAVKRGGDGGCMGEGPAGNACPMPAQVAGRRQRRTIGVQRAGRLRRAVHAARRLLPLLDAAHHADLTGCCLRRRQAGWALLLLALRSPHRRCRRTGALGLPGVARQAAPKEGEHHAQREYQRHCHLGPPPGR